MLPGVLRVHSSPAAVSPSRTASWIKSGVHLSVTFQAQGPRGARQGHAPFSKGRARPRLSWLPQPRGPMSPPTGWLPHLGDPVSGPGGPQVPREECGEPGGSSPPPGARCWPSGRACRTSARCSPRPAAAAWGTRTRLGPAELSATTTRAHTGQSASQARTASTPQVWGSLTFTEKLSPQSGSLDPEPLAASCSHGICHTHTGNMGDQATASTQPSPDAPSRRVPTPQHRHSSSVPSGLQHLWASPLFVTLSRPGPVFGACPSGWARLGSSGDWTGCGSGESPTEGGALRTPRDADLDHWVVCLPGASLVRLCFSHLSSVF